MIDLDELERRIHEAFRTHNDIDEWCDAVRALNAALRISAPKLIAMARRAQEYRSALAEVRAHLHATGRRPETCYEMSVIDAAMQEQEQNP